MRGEECSWQRWEDPVDVAAVGPRGSAVIVHRVTTCFQSSPPKPGSLALTEPKAITAVVHSTVFVGATGPNRRTMPERRPFVRLPADVYPVNYGLCLKPDLIDFTFEGKLEALVEVRPPEPIA